MNSRAIFFGIFLLWPHTEVIPQTLSASDGMMCYLAPGVTYKLDPHAPPDSTVTPLITGAEEGGPMQFVVHASAGETIRIKFQLPNQYVTACQDTIACRFLSDDLYWEERDQRLDPRIPQVVTADSSGKITLDIGIVITTPPSLHSGDFQIPTSCTIKTPPGDSLTASATFDVALLTGDPIPEYDGDLGILSRGYTYRVSPGAGANLINPIVNGREHAIVPRLFISGNAGSSVLVTFLLPKQLVPDNEEMGAPVSCRFDSDAVLVEETGARLDPNDGVTVTIGQRCYVTLDLGITVSVAKNAPVDTYTGQIIYSVAYTGNPRIKPRVPRQSEGEVLYTAGVRPDEIPREFTLLQNFPNPFNSSTTIRFGLPVSSTVRLSIFDLLGRQTATLIDGFESAGWHEVQWQGEQTPSGFYVYRLTAGHFTQVRKLLLLR